MVKLILDDINNLALVGGYTGLTALSGRSAVLILSAAVWMHQFSNWIGTGLILSQSEKDDIDAMVSEMEYEVMLNSLGLVIAFASASPPNGTLLCDGATHLRIDYPELYDAIDPVFKIDSSSFSVPDLTDRFIYGEGVNSLGDIGGAATQILGTANLPSHSHTYSQPGVGVVSGAPGIPTPTSSPPSLPNVTGSTGNNQPFDILPPYLVLGFCIISGVPS